MPGCYLSRRYIWRGFGEEISIDANHSHALTHFSRAFEKIFSSSTPINTVKWLFCALALIAPRDCLGPLVGHKLKLIQYNKIIIYGTLDHPVHAKISAMCSLK